MSDFRLIEVRPSVLTDGSVVVGVDDSADLSPAASMVVDVHGTNRPRSRPPSVPVYRIRDRRYRTACSYAV
jgi:hypothetical protein